MRGEQRKGGGGKGREAICNLICSSLMSHQWVDLCLSSGESFSSQIVQLFFLSLLPSFLPMVFILNLQRIYCQRYKYMRMTFHQSEIVIFIAPTNPTIQPIPVNSAQPSNLIHSRSLFQNFLCFSNNGVPPFKTTCHQSHFPVRDSKQADM